MTFEEVLDRFEAKRAGKEWLARCPAHDDHSPSLSITEKNGKILFKCWSQGCSFENILAAAGLTPADLNGAKSEGKPREKARAIPQNEKDVYKYQDEHHNVLFQAAR